MRIVILRHGKPSLPAWPWIGAHDLGNWINAYNRTGIGIINAFIARELLCAGWKGPGRTITPYWTRAEYTKA